MSESTGKHRKRYVDYPKGNSKPTCLINGPGHSSDKCKLLGYFGSQYAKSRPTKYRENNPIKRDKFNKHQENNDIVTSAVDEILPHENQKISSEKGAHENI